MVQILVKINDETQSLNEWAIIEVQGDLECNNGDTIAGKLIGHLFFTVKKKPLLIIGYQTLHGKIVENNPPLAVLKRNRTSTSNAVEGQLFRTEYEVLALVKKKITFKARPKPIV